MASTGLSSDSVVLKNGQHSELTPKEYGLLIRTLDNNLIKKDVKQLKFLCADFFNDKKFLAKEDVTAHDIFSQMKRSGTISNGNLTLLSQLLLLLGKKKLQQEVLNLKNIEWKEGMETSLSKFRLMLFRLYQDTRKEDFDKMKQYCSLRLDQDLPRAELERVTNALELFTVLIDSVIISTDNVDYLRDVVETLGSKHMLKLVTDYKETISSKDTGHQEKNKLSESPEIAQATQAFHGLSLIPGSSSKLKYDRFNSTDTSYMDERAPRSSLLRPGDILKRSGGTLSPEDNNLTHPVQPNEALAEGQLNSATARTAVIQKKLKDIHLPSQEEGREMRRPSGTLTVTSEAEDKRSINLDVHSGQHIERKPPHTKDHEVLKGEDDSLFPSPSLIKGLPEESPATSSDEEEEASESLSSSEEGATAWPRETPGAPRKPLVSTADEESDKAGSLFTSREMLGEMDPKNVNLTARTETEETELSKLKKSNHGNATSDFNSRESTLNKLRSVHHPPPQEAYKMSQLPRGKCLILTYDTFDDKKYMKKREGNDKDVGALKRLFQKKLGFKVDDHLNLDYRETLDVINEAANDSHKNSDCFVLIFCSHGSENALFTSDSKITKDPKDPKVTKFSRVIDIQELLTPFKPENCKSLAGKPKLFFINSCRREDELFQVFAEVDPDAVIAADGCDKGVASNLKLVPTEADFCVATSTVPGYSSARRREHGTIYVESLVHCLERDYKDYHLLDILTRVNNHLEESMKKHNYQAKKQGGKVISHVSAVFHTLGKAVYFGTHEE